MTTKKFSFGTVKIDFEKDEITIKMRITKEVIRTDINDTDNKINNQIMQSVIADFIEQNRV